MTISNVSNNYSLGFGASNNQVSVPVVAQVDPTTYNVQYPVGQRWINEASNNYWTLTSFNSSTGTVLANWQISASPSGVVSSLAGDSGSASPSSGVITVSGGSTGLTTSGSGSTLSLTGTLGVANGGTGAATLTSHGVLLGNTASAVTATAAGSNGQVLLGATSAAPAFGTLSSTTGISFTTGTNSLAINTTGGGLKANSVATSSATGATQNSYICSDSAQTTVSLPATAALGDLFIIAGTSANTGGWIVSCSSQTIFNSASSSTTSLSCTAASTSAILMCTTANSHFIVLASQGTVAYN